MPSPPQRPPKNLPKNLPRNNLPPNAPARTTKPPASPVWSPVEPGAQVAVVAACGPVPAEPFARGIQILRQYFDVRFDPDQIFARGPLTADDVRLSDGGGNLSFFAGDDRSRADALNRAFADPEVRAVFLARGGYGLTRILNRIDWDHVQGKPFIGFSDGTAFLGAAGARGLPTVHGPVVTQLGNLPEEDVSHLMGLLQTPPGLSPGPDAVDEPGRTVLATGLLSSWAQGATKASLPGTFCGDLWRDLLSAAISKSFQDCWAPRICRTPRMPWSFWKMWASAPTGSTAC